MRFIYLMLLFLITVPYSKPLHSQVIEEPRAQDYYPLAKGNSWKYNVIDASERSGSTVEWRVTSAAKGKDGVVYQVWLKPSQSDESAMRLRSSPSGIVEDSSGTFIFKIPATLGQKWETSYLGREG